MHSSPQRKRPAFTLVELLVVIGIIAVLVGILLPALNKARNSAKTLQCKSNLRQIGIAVQMYTNANHGFYPPGMAQDANQSFYNWTSLLTYMMDHKGGPTNSASDVSGGGTTGGFRKIFLCPSVEGFATFDPLNNAVTHYLSHPRLMPNMWNQGNGARPDPFRRAHGEPTATMNLYKQSNVKRSSEIVLAFDGSMSPLQGVSQTSGYSGSPF